MRPYDGLHADGDEVEDEKQYGEHDDAAGHDGGYRGHAEKEQKLHRVCGKPYHDGLERERRIRYSAEREHEGKQRYDDIGADNCGHAAEPDRAEHRLAAHRQGGYESRAAGVVHEAEHGHRGDYRHQA